MKDLKFIKAITDTIDKEHKPIGNCMYFELANGNIAKTYCEENGVCIDIINKLIGKVDTVYLPFAKYFEPTFCRVGNPLWYQHIDGDKWWFEKQYSHVVPTYKDYKNLSTAMEEFMNMYS